MILESQFHSHSARAKKISEKLWLGIARYTKLDVKIVFRCRMYTVENEINDVYISFQTKLLPPKVQSRHNDIRLGKE